MKKCRLPIAFRGCEQWGKVHDLFFRDVDTIWADANDVIVLHTRKPRPWLRLADPSQSAAIRRDAGTGGDIQARTTSFATESR
jgi:hypothetical protein